LSKPYQIKLKLHFSKRVLVVGKNSKKFRLSVLIYSGFHEDTESGCGLRFRQAVQKKMASKIVLTMAATVLTMLIIFLKWSLLMNSPGLRFASGSLAVEETTEPIAPTVGPIDPTTEPMIVPNNKQTLEGAQDPWKESKTKKPTTKQDPKLKFDGIRTLIVSDNDDNPLTKEQVEEMRRSCTGVRRVKHLQELNFHIIHTIDDIATIECVTEWLYDHSDQINLVAEDGELALDMAPHHESHESQNSETHSQQIIHSESNAAASGRQLRGIDEEEKLESVRKLDEENELDALDSEEDELDDQDENEDENEDEKEDKNQDEPAVTIPNDPYFKHQWALHQDLVQDYPDVDINGPEAWDLVRTQFKLRLEEGQGRHLPKPIIIAVIDSGVDYNHEDLKGKMWRNPHEIPNNGIDDDNNGYIDDIHGVDIVNEDGDPMDDDPFSHGTHVAGVIAANANNGKGTAGVASYLPGNTIQIMAIKIFAENPHQIDSLFGSSGALRHFLEACEYALKMGARLSNHSYSWMGFRNDNTNQNYNAWDLELLFVEAFIKLKARHDHIAFASAGNQGVMIGMNEDEMAEYYAKAKKDVHNARHFFHPYRDILRGHYERKSIPCGTFFVNNVICVASIRSEDGHLSEDPEAWGSNWGPAVHVAAPGDRIISTAYPSDIPDIHGRVFSSSSVENFDPLYGSLLPMNRPKREKSYLFGSGTSVATAHVTGLAALLLGVRPNLNSDEVMKLILDNVDKKDHLKPEIWRKELYIAVKTEGVINLEKSVREAIENFNAAEGPSSRVTKLSIFQNRDTNQRPGVFSGKIVLNLDVAECNTSMLDHLGAQHWNERDFVRRGEVQLWFLNKNAERLGVAIRYLNHPDFLEEATSKRGAFVDIVDQPIPPDAKYLAASTTWRAEDQWRVVDMHIRENSGEPWRWEVEEHTHRNGALTFGALAELKDNAFAWKKDMKLQPQNLIVDPTTKIFYWSELVSDSDESSEQKKETNVNEEQEKNEDADEEQKRETEKTVLNKKAALKTLNFEGSISFLPPDIGESEITHYNVYRSEWRPCDKRQNKGGPNLALKKQRAIDRGQAVCWAVCPFRRTQVGKNGENEQICVRSAKATAVERAQALITTIPAMNYRKPYCLNGSEDEENKSCDFITFAQQDAVDSEALKERFGERFSDDIHRTTHIAYDSDKSELAKNGEREHAWIVVTGPGILEFSYIENLTREAGLLSYPKGGQLFHGSTSRNKKIREIHFGPGKHSIEWSAPISPKEELESGKARKWELRFHSTARYANIPVHFENISYLLDQKENEVFENEEDKKKSFISSSIIVVPAYQNLNGASVEVNTKVVAGVDIDPPPIISEDAEISEDTEGKQTEVIHKSRPPFAKPVFAEFFDQNGAKNGFRGRVKLVAQKNGIHDRRGQSGTVRLHAFLGWYNDLNAIEDLTKKQPDGFLWHGSCEIDSVGEIDENNENNENAESDRTSCYVEMTDQVSLESDQKTKKWCLFVTEESFAEPSSPKTSKRTGKTNSNSQKEEGEKKEQEKEEEATTLLQKESPILPPLATLITRISDVTYQMYESGKNSDPNAKNSDEVQNFNSFLSFQSSLRATRHNAMKSLNDMRLSGGFHINALSFSKKHFIGLTGFRLEFEDATLNSIQEEDGGTSLRTTHSTIGDITLPHVCGAEVANVNGGVYSNIDASLANHHGRREGHRRFRRTHWRLPASFAFAPGNCVPSLSSLPEPDSGLVSRQNLDENNLEKDENILEKDEKNFEKILGPVAPKCIPPGFSFGSLFKEDTCRENNVEISLKEEEKENSKNNKPITNEEKPVTYIIKKTIKYDNEDFFLHFPSHYRSFPVFKIIKLSLGKYNCGSSLEQAVFNPSFREDGYPRDILKEHSEGDEFQLPTSATLRFRSNWCDSELGNPSPPIRNNENNDSENENNENNDSENNENSDFIGFILEWTGHSSQWGGIGGFLKHPLKSGSIRVSPIYHAYNLVKLVEAVDGKNRNHNGNRRKTGMVRRVDLTNPVVFREGGNGRYDSIYDHDLRNNHFYDNIDQNLRSRRNHLSNSQRAFKAPGVSINLNLENQAKATCKKESFKDKNNINGIRQIMECWVPIGLEIDHKPKWLERYNVKEEEEVAEEVGSINWNDVYWWTPIWETVDSRIEQEDPDPKETDEEDYTCSPKPGFPENVDDAFSLDDSDLSLEDITKLKQGRLAGSYFKFPIGKCGSSKHTAYDLESGKVKTFANVLIVSRHIPERDQEFARHIAKEKRVFMDCRCEIDDSNDNEGGNRRLLSSSNGNDEAAASEAASTSRNDSEEMEKQLAAFEKKIHEKKKELEKKDNTQQGLTLNSAMHDSQLSRLALSAPELSAPAFRSGRNNFTERNGKKPEFLHPEFLQPDLSEREKVTVVWEEEDGLSKEDEKSGDSFELGLTLTDSGSAASLLGKKKVLENALKHALLVGCSKNLPESTSENGDPNSENAKSETSVLTVSVTSISEVVTTSPNISEIVTPNTNTTETVSAAQEKSIKSTRIAFRLSFDSDFFQKKLSNESVGKLSKNAKLRLQLETRLRLLAQNAPRLVEKFAHQLRSGSGVSLKIKKDDVSFNMIERRTPERRTQNKLP